MILLQVSGLAKSVYYYTLSKIDKDDKNKEIIDKIKEIFINNKERYGYRRITLELRNQGYNVNHKKVYRIMVKLGLKPLKRNKRKYSSYKGTVGKIADNLIERDFNADKPNKKWYTDVTEFNLRGEKCYLSPILDGYNGEVISYNISKSPNLEQINDMLNKAFDKNNNLDGLIFHSDQGWQYQHQSYQQRLKNNGIKQSMSRKGNSMDNGMMENFFGILKTEMFYDQEDNYKTLEDLIKAIDDYIYYYNYDRIKVKLKGLSPVNYRLQSSNQKLFINCPTFGVQFSEFTTLFLFIKKDIGLIQCIWEKINIERNKPMSMNNYILNLLNIEDRNIFILPNIEERIIKNKKYKIIEGILTYIPDFCPCCGCVNESHNAIIKWGYRKNCKVKIPKISNCFSLLILHKQRFFCRNYNKTFIAKTSLIDKNKNISNNTELQINLELMIN